MFDSNSIPLPGLPGGIDLRRLCHDLRSCAKEARVLKRMLGQTWTRPMAGEQRLLAELRKRTTRLCILRAFLRGKHHLRNPPRDGWAPHDVWEPDAYHARIAERTAREYLIESHDVRAV